MDLNALRLKTVSQLDDSEKAFLKEHETELNDEDRDAYKDFLQGNEESSQEAGETEEDSTGSEVSTEEAADTTATEPVVEETPSYAFKSEEEAKDFVRQQVEEREKQKQAAIDAAKTPEEKKYVADNWEPENWNEALKVAVKTAKEEMRKEDEEKRIEETGKRLQAEWEEITKENNLPKLTTPEGKKIHDSVVNLGVALNKQGFKDAYEAWKVIPKEHGGGFDATISVTTPEPKKDPKQIEKDKIASQKKAAAKLGGQGQTANTTVSGSLETPDYDTLHQARSVSELLRKQRVI